MRIRNNRVLAVAAGAGILLASSSVGAVAAKLVTSDDIKNGTIQSQDIGNGEVQKQDIAANSVGANEIVTGSVNLNSLSDDAKAALVGAQGAVGPQGPAGPAGKDGERGPAGPAGQDGADGVNGTNGVDGEDGRDGLAGAVYRVTEYANGGTGDATTACADTEAESQEYTAIAGGVEAGVVGAPNAFAVTASFPGRMNWSTGTPKPGRLDGWIVLGNGQRTEKLRVWALCVPTTSIETQVVTIDN